MLEDGENVWLRTDAAFVGVLTGDRNIELRYNQSNQPVICATPENSSNLLYPLQLTMDQNRMLAGTQKESGFVYFGVQLSGKLLVTSSFLDLDLAGN